MGGRGGAPSQRSCIYWPAACFMRASAHWWGWCTPAPSLAKPIGVSEVGLGLLQIAIAVGAALVPLLWMLRGTRLQTDDLRITVPAPWSPAFCLPVFLGVASTANLCGGLLVRWPGQRTPPPCCPAAAQSCSCSFWRFAPCPLWWRNCFSAAHCKAVRPTAVRRRFRPGAAVRAAASRPGPGADSLRLRRFSGLLAERSGSILPGMLLHFCNNTLAFLNLYLRFYAPAAGIFWR